MSFRQRLKDWLWNVLDGAAKRRGLDMVSNQDNDARQTYEWHLPSMTTTPYLLMLPVQMDSKTMWYAVPCTTNTLPIILILRVKPRSSASDESTD